VCEIGLRRVSLYTFYCCKPDGSAPSLEMHDLPNDTVAAQRCETLLMQHASCSHVLACEGDREVATRVRKGVSLPASSPSPHPQPALPKAIGRALADKRLELAGAALIATTPEGTVVYWNEAATRLYGWEPEEALGRNVIDVTPALQSKEQATSIMTKLQTGEPWEGEIVLRRRDGTPFKAFVADLMVGDGDTCLILGASAAAANRSAVRAIAPLLRTLQL
jgi:PAS domain S-box-containing protein